MLLAASHPGFWTANRVLVLTNSILAGATLVLALVALLSIRSSNRLAEAAEEQAKAVHADAAAALEQVRLGQQELEQSRAALEASVRPLLVDVPPGLYVRSVGRLGETEDDSAIQCYETPTRVFVRVPLRNVGPGPAFIQEAVIGMEGLMFPADSSRRVVPPGELVDVELNAQGDVPGYSTLLQRVAHVALTVSVVYADLGQQRTATEIDLARPTEHADILAYRVRLYRFGPDGTRDDKPFASSGPH